MVGACVCVCTLCKQVSSVCTHVVCVCVCETLSLVACVCVRVCRPGLLYVRGLPVFTPLLFKGPLVTSEQWLDVAVFTVVEGVAGRVPAHPGLTAAAPPMSGGPG